MRVLLAFLLWSAGISSLASDAPRVPIDGTKFTVAHPAGWTSIPMHSDPPAVLFALCGAIEGDGCLVLGEMTLGLQAEGRRLLSLDQILEAVRTNPDLTTPPEKVHLGTYDAVLTVGQGRHSNHIDSIVSRGNFAISTASGNYDCMLTTAPDRFRSLSQAWREFCASLDLVGLKPD